MFKGLVGQTIEENALFYQITDLIIKSFPLMTADFYFLRLEKAADGKSTVCEYREFADYEGYARFIFAHEYQPQYIIFEKNDDHVKLRMTGFYKFMSHDIYGTKFELEYQHDKNPDRPLSAMPSRELIEKGFAEIRGELAVAPRAKRTV